MRVGEPTRAFDLCRRPISATWLKRMFAGAAAIAGLSLAVVFVGVPEAHAALTDCKSNAYLCTPGYTGDNASSTWAWKYYGPPWSDTPTGTHNCTLYVAFRLAQDGMPDPGHAWGNANDWAASIGGGNHTPVVGSVAWWKNDSLGHVGYVEQVSGDQVFIRSDNFVQSGGYTSAGWVAANSVPLFLHPNDVGRYVGHIVQQEGDTKVQKTSWRVGSDLRRRWIPYASTYNCLRGAGVPGPDPVPSAILSGSLRDITGSRAPCGGDLNGDGVVNFLDVSILASDWNQPWNYPGGVWADVNLDGAVNFLDLSILAAQMYGPPRATPVAGATVVNSAGAEAVTGVNRTIAKASMAVAAPVTTPLLSRVGGNALTSQPSVSADGQLVAFVSAASDLVPGDANGVNDVFAWDLSKGSVTRVSLASNGVEAAHPSADPRVSADGRFIVFDTAAELTADDTDSQVDVYVWDQLTGALERVSQPTGNPTGSASGPAYAAGVTPSGLVIFQSNAGNLVAGDTNGTSDVFARTMPGGAIERLSVSSSNAESHGDSFSASVNPDGRFVAFASRAEDLLQGDSNGSADIFVRDLSNDTTTLVSVSSAGGSSGGTARSPSMSSDGHLIAFDSDATDLTPGGSQGVRQVYVRDLTAGTTRLASAANDGTSGNLDSTEPALSGNGSRIAFRSLASNLVPGDTNAAEDVFAADLTKGLIGRVSVSGSYQQAGGSSFGPSLNADGRLIAFPSDADNLQNGDTNGVSDVFVRSLDAMMLSAATPTITGTAKVGSVLTAHPGTWGPAPVTLAYQWKANGAPITGAVGSTFTVPMSTISKAITVTLTGSETGYTPVAMTSASTATVPRVTTGVSSGASSTTVTYGGAVTISGTLRRSDSGAALVGLPVVVEYRTTPTGAWKTARTLTASAAGAVTTSFKPSAWTSYRLRYAGNSSYAPAISTARTVAVRTKVTLTASAYGIRRGQSVTFSGAVNPSHAGKVVYLQRYTSGGWKTYTTLTLSSTSTYRRTVTMTSTVDYSWRVVRPADADHATGVSPTRRINVT